MTAKEVAKMTGLAVSTIHKLARQGRIPAKRGYRPQKVVFSEHQILQWMKEDDYKLMPKRGDRR